MTAPQERPRLRLEPVPERHTKVSLEDLPGDRGVVLTLPGDYCLTHVMQTGAGEARRTVVTLMPYEYLGRGE